MSAVKIIVCGDVMGNFRALFPKIEELNKTRGPFEMFPIFSLGLTGIILRKSVIPISGPLLSLYCVGNFFGSKDEEYEDLKSGKIEVPLVTYIINGNQTSFKELYEPLEKAVPKIVYLGKMGRIVGSTGLKIAYLSGVELPENLHNNKNAVEDTFNMYNIYISRRLVKSMINSIGAGTDILLTSQWPKDVTNYAISLDKDHEGKIKDGSSYSISYLAKHLKPRYHFCGLSGLYYERVPYRNHVDMLEKPVPVTRFIGLAPVKKGKMQQKEKWLYAFNITPQIGMTHQQLLQSPGPATVSPYGNLIDSDDTEKNFFFDSSVNNPGPSSKKRSTENDSGNRPKRPAIDASTCWFCLSNTKVEKQLIITIGNHCYITLAKGVLVPEHVFIVPINHIASSVGLSSEAFEEVENFKTALANYFHDKNKDVVFFERNYRSPHLQIQVVPIPKQMHSEIEDKLYSHAYNFEVTPLPTLANIKELTPGRQEQYFYFELRVNKKSHGRYLAFIESSVKDFPLQIGRHILADVLDAKDRINWQECTNSVEEKKMAERMRESFKRYDFAQK